MSFFQSLFGRGPAAPAGPTPRERVAQGAVLLDVRTTDEFAQGHIEGALNIPLHVLPARIHELKTSQPVVVYCRSGGRSAQAAQLLTKAGFADVHNLGPMSAW